MKSMEKFGLTLLILSKESKSGFGELMILFAPPFFKQYKESYAHNSLPCVLQEER